MDKTAYTNLAKAWRYAEDAAMRRQSEAMGDARAAAEAAGMPQGSAAQAAFLATLVRLTDAEAVIAVGTGSVVETMALVEGLDGAGHLTAVDSSAEGVALVRAAFAALEGSTDTTLRAVNAAADVFLPRLNAGVYDLVVVSGDAANYAATLGQAPRLLRAHGALVFTDVLAFQEDPDAGGVLNPADRGAKAVAMRAFLEALEDSADFEATLISVGTGLVLATRR